MTIGISAIVASEIDSAISDRPGPDVAVNARTPAKFAPIAIMQDASSSSVCTTAPCTRSIAWIMYSMISDAGVIG